MALPWSTSALRRLGVCIRDGVPAPAELPDYGEVMLWYTDLAALVQKEIASISWSDVLSSKSCEVTSRPKTIDTLREKLQRDRSTPLPSIQDVAGVRFEAEMTLSKQDEVVHAIVERFSHDPLNAVHDLRAVPHSGYRAVHIWLRLDGTVDPRLTGRVEVQVRTHLQSAWANMYESAADFLGRNIRYDELPEDREQADLVIALRKLSQDQIKTLEETLNEIERIESEILAAYAVLTSLHNRPNLRSHRDLEEAGQTLEGNVARVKELKRRKLNEEYDLRAQMKTLQSVFQGQRNSSGVV